MRYSHSCRERVNVWWRESDSTRGINRSSESRRREDGVGGQIVGEKIDSTSWILFLRYLRLWETCEALSLLKRLLCLFLLVSLPSILFVLFYLINPTSHLNSAIYYRCQYGFLIVRNYSIITSHNVLFLFIFLMRQLCVDFQWKTFNDITLRD